jgi:xanthine dehydrogenase accessory factor
VLTGGGPTGPAAAGPTREPGAGGVRTDRDVGAGDVVTAADAARAALTAYEGGPAVAVVLQLDGPDAGRRLLVLETGEARGSLGSPTLDAQAASLARQALGVRAATGGAEVVEVAEGARLYVEVHVAPEELVIVGAGHIAVPLARLGVMLGYRVTVLDDREEFAMPARFPEEATVLRMDFGDPFRGVAIGPRTHVLLVTRAHKYDFDCLKHLLTRDPLPRYIGMIGSRRRVRATFQALLEAGIPRERVARVSAPVGLDIGAETPEEIAVSIAAELVAVRRMGVGAVGAVGAPVASASAAGGMGVGASDAGAASTGDAVDPGNARPADSAQPAESAGAAAPHARRSPLPLSAKERVLDRLLPEVDHG